MAYLFCYCSDESFVVRDDDHTAIPGTESRHQCIKTLRDVKIQYHIK